MSAFDGFRARRPLTGFGHDNGHRHGPAARRCTDMSNDRPAVKRARIQRLGQADSDSTRLAMADLRFAAWFLWMTPLLTALSSWRDATRSSVVAAAVSPASLASLSLRITVFSDVLTVLVRSRAGSFCRLRLIWDLMFATRQPCPD